MSVLRAQSYWLFIAAAFAGTGALVDVRLSVPVEESEVTVLKVGGRVVPIRAKRTHPGRRILILEQANEATVRELRDALKACDSCFANVEVWGSGGDGRTVGITRFAEGWVGILWNRPPPEKQWRWLPGPSEPDILRSVADRFAGHGPIEVYLLDTSFSWLDCRMNDDCRLSPIERDYERFGDAGLTVYPILVPTKRTVAVGQRFVRSVLGTTVKVANGEPGAALVEALRDSERHTQVSFSMVPFKSIWKPPPTLEVLNSANKVVHRRPFLATGTKAGGFPPGQDPTAQELYRIVPEVEIERGVHGRGSCGENRLWLSGVRLPGGQQGVIRVSVARTDFYEDGRPGMSYRNESAQWVQNGDEACVGPLHISNPMNVSFYDPISGWGAFLRLR